MNPRGLGAQGLFRLTSVHFRGVSLILSTIMTMQGLETLLHSVGSLFVGGY